ncbi:ATP-binding protein [Coraliomargarita parva]|uniref:ATP-binding protein n=1 Tax=Coraliomargarita parva TaxID=3014050 RepID=UPI0022B44307|nr:ATP-binding protein [Coraliomargarita parva]
MIRIVLTGAESTGKTTLAQALSGYYGEPWTPEYVREYVDSLSRPLQAQDLEAIARGQFAVEDAGAAQASRMVFHDTNILSSIIYANHYFGTVLDWVNTDFLQRDYTHYLLCLPDIPWIADAGQRESPAAREQLHGLFKESLDRLKLPYTEIGGEQGLRANDAIRLIDSILETYTASN